MSMYNFVRSYKHGKIAGPDPWKANTLEWFTTSPPPVNNFDVGAARALGRADARHPPRGRSADRRLQKTGGSEQFARV